MGFLVFCEDDAILRWNAVPLFLVCFISNLVFSNTGKKCQKNRKDVRFFGLPLLTIKTKGNKNTYKLFGLIPFLKIMEK